MDTPQKLSPLQRLTLGLISLAVGLFPMLAAFDIGPLHREDISGPPWLGFVAGGLFFLAGVSILIGRVASLASSALTVLMLAGFAAIGNWIAFGAGERHCSGGLSLGVFWGEGDLPGLGCRIPFGLGALVLDGMLVYVAVASVQKALGGPPRLVKLMKWAGWVLLTCLAPILVPLLFVLLIRTAAGAVVTRLKTGSWPRNEEFIVRQQKRKGLPVAPGHQDAP